MIKHHRVMDLYARFSRNIIELWRNLRHGVNYLHGVLSDPARSLRISQDNTHVARNSLLFTAN